MTTYLINCCANPIFLPSCLHTRLSPAQNYIILVLWWSYDTEIVFVKYWSASLFHDTLVGEMCIYSHTQIRSDQCLGCQSALTLL